VSRSGEPIPRGDDAGRVDAFLPKMVEERTAAGICSQDADRNDASAQVCEVVDGAGRAARRLRCGSDARSGLRRGDAEISQEANSSSTKSPTTQIVCLENAAMMSSRRVRSTVASCADLSFLGDGRFRGFRFGLKKSPPW
jgi:hypothetical protein